MGILSPTISVRTDIDQSRSSASEPSSRLSVSKYIFIFNL